ncbi:BTB And Kelch [Ostertagia ostertagi]
MQQSQTYFEAMFTSDMAESRMVLKYYSFCLYIPEEIEIVDMETSTLETLVDYCYSGKIVISDANVSSILPAACLLQLDEVQAVLLQKQCCEFLKNGLNLSNCLGIRVLAYTYSCQELLHSADKYILRNFQDILGTEEFHQLPVDQVIELISSDELRVFTAVLQWVRFDLRDRKQSLFNLLEHVRLPFCNPEFLVSTVSDNALVMENLDCRDLVDEAKNYQLLKVIHKTPNMLGPRTRPRKVKVHELIYAGMTTNRLQGGLDK